VFAAVCAVVVTQFGLGQRAAMQPDTAGMDSSAALTAFDVVSIKPLAQDGRMMRGFRYLPDGIQADATTVSTLVWNAYGGFTKLPTEDSVAGLPDWTKTAYFAVEAKMSEAQTAEFAKLGREEKQQRLEAMLQALLADRFKLKVHRELRQVPDYELVIAKGGPKLKEGADPNGPKDKDGKPMTLMTSRGPGSFQAQGFTMEGLAGFLGEPFVGTGRIVKDKTGLTGKYSFALTFAMQGSPTGPPGGAVPVAPTAPAAADDSLPSIFTALQEQLGLKLQPGTGSLDVVVVDHVERPTVN
jgi:uncharacterized protein (TIGR03435 family)